MVVGYIRLKVVIWRNIDALAVSKDQAIFFLRSSNFALLDKVDDGLGKSVMLELIFYVVPGLPWGRLISASSPLWLKASTTKLALPD